MKITASGYYTRGRGNSAQAVCYSAEKYCGISASMIKQFERSGTGQAPCGMCGALYAAIRLCGADLEKGIVKKFKSLTGGMTRCSDIKKSGSITCRECVEISAKIVEEYIQTGGIISAA